MCNMKSATPSMNIPALHTLVITILVFTSSMSYAQSSVRIVAHRGASADFPENTLVSMREGFAQGADAGELDVLTTADGVPILMHDSTLKRTVGMEGGPIAYTWEELRDRDAGAWKDPRFAGEKIPTLADALQTVPDGKQIYVEIRVAHDLPACIRDIDESGLTSDQIVVISFDYQTVANVKKMRPDWTAYWILSLKKSTNLDEVIDKAVEAKLDGLDLAANDLVTASLVRRMREANLSFHVWTVNGLDVAERMIELGVESITTDRPGWLREQISKL